VGGGGSRGGVQLSGRFVKEKDSAKFLLGQGKRKRGADKAVVKTSGVGKEKGYWVTPYMGEGLF